MLPTDYSFIAERTDPQVSRTDGRTWGSQMDWAIPTSGNRYDLRNLRATVIGCQ